MSSFFALACCGGRASLVDPQDEIRGGAGGGALSPGSSAPIGSPIPPGERAPVAEGAVVSVGNDTGAPDRASSDPPSASCEDVGTFVGLSACCGGKLCNGMCSRDRCVCGSIRDGGCPWPLRCCGSLAGGACVGPESPSCRAIGNRLEKDTRPVVNEGNACGVEFWPLLPYAQMCCNGEICRGRCVLPSDAGKRVCDCGYAEGGCPAPLNCCRGERCVEPGGCMEPPNNK
jgi:hypothetical protein